MNQVTVPSPVILIKASMCFEKARLNIIQGAELLYHISKENLWEGQHSSFGEFVQEKCQLSEGYASKLVKAYEHYVIAGGLSHAKLTGIDPEKLYLAINLKGTPEEQALRAQMLTRQEIVIEIKEINSGVHDHSWDELHFKQCKHCGLREKIYES